MGQESNLTRRLRIYTVVKQHHNLVLNVPSWARDILGLKRGDQVIAVVDGSWLRFRKLLPEDIARMCEEGGGEELTA